MQTSLEQRGTLRHWGTQAERVAINIGMELYKRHPEGVVTAKAIMQLIARADGQDWGTGRRKHGCGSSEIDQAGLGRRRG